MFPCSESQPNLLITLITLITFPFIAHTPNIKSIFSHFYLIKSKSKLKFKPQDVTEKAKQQFERSVQSLKEVRSAIDLQSTSSVKAGTLASLTQKSGEAEQAQLGYTQAEMCFQVFYVVACSLWEGRVLWMYLACVYDVRYTFTSVHL